MSVCDLLQRFHLNVLKMQEQMARILTHLSNVTVEAMPKGVSEDRVLMKEVMTLYARDQDNCRRDLLQQCHLNALKMQEQMAKNLMSNVTVEAMTKAQSEYTVEVTEAVMPLYARYKDTCKRQAKRLL